MHRVGNRQLRASIHRIAGTQVRMHTDENRSAKVRLSEQIAGGATVSRFPSCLHLLEGRQNSGASLWKDCHSLGARESRCSVFG
jgi:hypothetical protein